ncbi:cytochrome P450 [Endogone sp. FLAS-F59071]|nr:cytochrome P450 [Endogone sp. FLAS-F59071]|eukprot:RUS22052.1 cytochrome P450 [Endogone sp. FLAS-F59071]
MIDNCACREFLSIAYLLVRYKAAFGFQLEQNSNFESTLSTIIAMSVDYSSFLTTVPAGQLLAYAGAGIVASIALLAAKYPDRAIFQDKRSDINSPKEWPLVVAFLLKCGDRGNTLLIYQSRCYATILLIYIGSLPSMAAAQAKLLDWMLQHFQDHGPTWTFTALALPRNILTADPRNLEHILKNNFENYPKGPILFERMYEMMGHGIFNSDGPQWVYQRKTASHIFTVKNFRDWFTGVFVQHLNDMKNHVLDKVAESGAEVDLTDLMHKFTLDSFVQLGFGVHLGALRQDKLPFARAFDAVQAQTGYRLFSPFWKMEELFSRIFMPWKPSMEDHVKVIDNFAYNIIQQRRDDPEYESKNDLLSRFMNALDNNGNPLSDKQLRDVMMNFIIAARDTTAQALSWTFYRLALHPEVEEKLLAEILEYVHEDMTPDELHEAVKKMKYAHAVFFEVLRFHPSVPLEQRYAFKDDVWPDGTQIKGGDVIGWCIYAQGRLENLWGPDSLEFRPERWIVDGDLLKVSQGHWPVFHGGPRLCLGKSLAILECLVGLSFLVKQYRFALVPGQDITYMRSLTLPMKNGMRVHVQRRNL